MCSLKSHKTQFLTFSGLKLNKDFRDFGSSGRHLLSLSTGFPGVDPLGLADLFISDGFCCQNYQGQTRVDPKNLKEEGLNSSLIHIKQLKVTRITIVERTKRCEIQKCNNMAVEPTTSTLGACRTYTKLEDSSLKRPK